LNKYLKDRQMSGFPVSIGTGLSLETLFNPIEKVYDETREVPEKIELGTYSVFSFNVLTILRNLINSVQSNLLDIPVKDIYNELINEIQFIDDFFRINGLNIKLYINLYENVEKKYSEDLRIAKTSKQLYTKSVFDFCITNLRKEEGIILFNDKIEYSKKDKVLNFTHIPYDLLSYINFAKLDLLESNTGIVKERHQFNTKYFKVPNKDMSFLPFVEKLLIIFGDKVMFKPKPIKERIRVYDILYNKNVNPMTNEGVIKLLI